MYLRTQGSTVSLSWEGGGGGGRRGGGRRGGGRRGGERRGGGEGRGGEEGRGEEGRRGEGRRGEEGRGTGGEGGGEQEGRGRRGGGEETPRQKEQGDSLEILKRTPKRYPHPVWWVWLECFSPLRGKTISFHKFWFKILKDTEFTNFNFQLWTFTGLTL